ncbi:MAG: NAD-dependent epimerase/dehydratase family protein [Janthinobacterium lividum]
MDSDHNTRSRSAPYCRRSCAGMKALVTGAQGFVGRYVCAALLHEDPSTQVFGIGRSVETPHSFSHRLSLRSGVPAPLPEGLAATLADDRYHYTPLDILDGASLRRFIDEVRPDSILHLASGLRGDADSGLIKTNIQGTATLLQSVATIGMAVTPRVVIGSSGGVYGRFSDDQLPLTESTSCDPADVYSATKLAAEHIARVIGRTHGIPVIVARMFNIVGPGQSERHVAGHFARALHAHISAGTTFSVGQLNTTRDFIDVRDIANALLLLASRAEPDTIYNVASGDETRTQSVLDLLIRCSGLSRSCYAQETNELAGGVPRHWADISLLRALNFSPHISLAQSLSDVFHYYGALQPF